MQNNTERLDNIMSQMRSMRLSTMADHLHTLYLSESQSDEMTLLDCLEYIVNEEYQIRQNNRIERYKKQAGLTHKQAHISDITYSESRGLHREIIEQLSTNHYIHHQNVIVQGATGTGKSYLANALVNHAIESGFTGRYYRMTELLNDMNYEEFQGRLDKLLKKLIKVDVLVIDDFLLTSTNEQEQKYLMEVLEMRSRDKSLILCSQMASAEWHKKLGGGAIADAILDRATSKAYKLLLRGESFRQL